MCLKKILAALMEMGHPEKNVACFRSAKNKPADLTVQIRLGRYGIGFFWTWFGFPDEGDADFTSGDVAALFVEAAGSTEWYLDEIPLDEDLLV